MIRKFLMPLTVLLVLFSGTRCIPERNGPGPGLVGKLVVDAACGHYVVEVIQGNIDASRLVSEWKDSTTDSIYVNVFGLSDPCYFGQYGLVKGNLFRFELDDKPPAEGCPLCYIAYRMPPVSNAVKNVQKIN
jgi:hypothetical protein